MKLALTTCLATLLTTAAWAETTITDLRDRALTLNAPAERVLLGFYYEDYLAVVGDGAVDKLVGDPPQLKWSAPIVRKRRIKHGNQTTQARRDCHESAAG